MNLISSLVDIFVNLDKNLILVANTYGILAYPLLFLIIFLETGIVIAPFLPGDSLLFAAGALSAIGVFNIFILFIVVAIAAILGDTVNYWIGRYLGESIIKRKILRREYIDRTHNFYEKYGGKTIILARFVPIIRTFAPFIAGVGKMKYSKFITYNVIGGLAWVVLFLFLGFFFGNLPFVQKNFTLVIFAIIFISILPAIIEYLRSRTK